MLSDIVVTAGTFDLFHRGHARLLGRCFRRSEHPIILVNTDEFVTSFKGQAPVQTFDERFATLVDTYPQARVYKNDFGNDIVASLDFHMLPKAFLTIVVGSDWLGAGKDYLAQVGLDQNLLHKNNIEILFVPYTKGISSTELRQRLACDCQPSSPLTSNTTQTGSFQTWWGGPSDPTKSS